MEGTGNVESTSVGCPALDAVLVERLGRARRGIVHARVDAELAQLAVDVGDLAVAQIVAVFLEGDAEDADAGALHRDVGVDEQLHELLGDERPCVARCTRVRHAAATGRPEPRP